MKRWGLLGDIDEERGTILMVGTAGEILDAQPAAVIVVDMARHPEAEVGARIQHGEHMVAGWTLAEWRQEEEQCGTTDIVAGAGGGLARPSSALFGRRASSPFRR